MKFLFLFAFLFVTVQLSLSRVPRKRPVFDGTENETYTSKQADRKKKNLKKDAQKYKLVLDVKPAEANTNMTELESRVRQMGLPGLHWDEAKILPVAFTIKKLQIACTINRERNVYLLEDMITNEDDVVQSVDVVSMHKI